MYCENCGFENDPEAKFCANCGTKKNEATKEDSDSADALPVQEDTQSDSQDNTQSDSQDNTQTDEQPEQAEINSPPIAEKPSNEPTQGSKKNKFIWIPFAAGVAVIALIIVALLLFNNDTDNFDVNESDENLNEAVVELTEPPETIAEPTPAIETTPIDETLENEGPESSLIEILTSNKMREFEAANAVTEEQERYLAFGPFVLTANMESVRVLALDISHDSAEMILYRSWGVTDKESAIDQLERLANADGQSPAADDIFNVFIKTGRLDELDPFDMLVNGFDFTGLENVVESTKSRIERMPEALESYIKEYEDTFGRLSKADRELVEESFFMINFSMRVNDGIMAYSDAVDLLTDSIDSVSWRGISTELGFTEEELLNIDTLAAWDYGRTAIIARYSVAAGYIDEDVAWEYLKIAADNASEFYSDWREYTAAHILGRAIAFGSGSFDFAETLEYLLNHEESPFQRIAFK